MVTTVTNTGTNRGSWRRCAAVTLGVTLVLFAVAAAHAYDVTPSSILFSLVALVAGAGLAVVGLVSVRVRQKLNEQHQQLDVALNNMNQGLCSFDAQNSLVVWNERYREMYNIDPRRICADAVFPAPVPMKT